MVNRIPSNREQIKPNSVFFKKPTRPNKWKYRQSGKTTKFKSYYCIILEWTNFHH